MTKIAHDMLLNETLSMTDLAGSPMTINGMKLLELASETRGIDLTESGFLNRKCVVWAAEEFQWPGYEPAQLYKLNKVLNEQDFLPLSVMHNLMVLGRLVQHRTGKAILTLAGKDFLGDFGRLQAQLFDTYFTQFDFRANERFPTYIEQDDFRHSFGVVANRLSDWVTLQDFAHLCLPVNLIPSKLGRPEFEACLHMRSNIVQPLCWFGLMEEEVATPETLFKQRRVRKTALFDSFLRFSGSKSPNFYN